MKFPRPAFRRVVAFIGLFTAVATGALAQVSPPDLGDPPVLSHAARVTVRTSGGQTFGLPGAISALCANAKTQVSVNATGYFRGQPVAVSLTGSIPGCYPDGTGIPSVPLIGRVLLGWGQISDVDVGILRFGSGSFFGRFTTVIVNPLS